MKNNHALILLILLLPYSTLLTAQCTGGRYHDLVFPGSPVVTYDVVYGSNLNYLGVTESLKMDIYEPACDNGTNRALVVFAHGGSFVSGDKGDASYVQTAVALAKLGYVVANINYRLGFEQTFPAVQYSFNSAIMRGVHDARAAIRHCRNNALNGGNTWRIDVNNIFFGGVSAGGIIALHLGYQNLQSEHNMSCNNQAGSECSSIEGTSNLLAVSSSVKAIVSIAGGIRDLTWITTNDIPVFLAHGTLDGTVPYGSGTFGGFFPVHGSSSIATRCNTTGTKYCFKPMYGQDHVPSNPAYVDTVATIMRNFLEHLTCGVTLNCNYTSSPTAASASVSIAITSGSNSICTGASVTFTATPTNGGTSPSYQWKKGGSNVGTNSSTYTSTALANNDAITCVMTPDAACSTPTPVTSNSITMSVSTAGAPTVVIAITSGSNPTCTGSSVTFTATPTNGGSAPSYQWKVNGGNVGTNSNTYTSSALTNNAVISCVLTSNSSCANPTTATSNSITMTVSSAVAPTVAIAITSGSNPTCSGSAITFTATPTNGGSAPSYQWKVNGSNAGTNSSNYTSSALTNNAVVTCVLTSNSSCANPTTATSNSITISVSTSVAPSVSIALISGSNPTCAGSSLTFSATPTNGGTTPSYQWKKNGSNTGTNNSGYTLATPANNDVISCVMTSNATCASASTATSNSVTVTVTSTVVPSVFLAITAGSNPTCVGSSVTFSATPTNGGTSPAYQWKVNGTNVGTNSSTYSSSSLSNNAIVSCVLTSSSSCANPTAANSNSISMNVNALPVITQSGNTLTSSASSSYQWYRNSVEISNATNQTYTATTSGSYTVLDGNDCQAEAIDVTVTAVIDPANNEYFILVYPNPSSGNFQISFNAAANETYKLKIKNLLGASFYEETLTDITGPCSRQIDITQYGKGIYMILLVNSNRETVKKVIVY